MTGERPDICARCGDCCRTRPGVEAPERFLADADPAAALSRALASRDWVLARHVEVACPRPATIAERAVGTVHAGAETSPCVFLEATGCRLTYEGRPRMCRELEPWANGDCQARWDLPEAVRAWAPLQGLIHEALSQLPGSPAPTARVQRSAKE